jgi:ABC-2 type transport system ATP-binding protein
MIAVGTPAELGEKVMHTAQRVEVEVAHDAVGRALDVLRRVPGVREASAEADVIVAQGAGRETVPRLLSALVAAGVRVYRVLPQEPSLEDVYFALHGDTVDAWGEEVVK